MRPRQAWDLGGGEGSVDRSWGSKVGRLGPFRCAGYPAVGWLPLREESFQPSSLCCLVGAWIRGFEGLNGLK